MRPRLRLGGAGAAERPGLRVASGGSQWTCAEVCGRGGSFGGVWGAFGGWRLVFFFFGVGLGLFGGFGGFGGGVGGWRLGGLLFFCVGLGRFGGWR